MLTIQRTRKNNSKSNAGFIIADFLFAFVLVIGVGIIIFAFTFSLATIEITQYIVWSTARNYAASSVTEVDANKSAKEKFKNLRKQFPMLATQGGAGWFELSDVTVGDLAKVDSSFSNKVTSSDLANNSAGGERRQPWTGASAVIKLKLFSSLQIPFLGKVAKDKDSFSFPIRAFIIRSPSTEECKTFFKKRFREGISQIDQFQTMTQGLSSPPPINPADVYGVGQEDNGC